MLYAASPSYLAAHHICAKFCASDYINPIDLCNRLNTYIVPEAAVHGFLTFLFLINGYWVALVLNLPLLAWNGKKYAVCCATWRLKSLTESRIFENQHLLDATEIFRKLNVHKKVRIWLCPDGTHGWQAVAYISSLYTSQLLAYIHRVAKANRITGIIHQAGVSLDHVFLLPLQHDCCPHPRRIALDIFNLEVTKSPYQHSTASWLM
jgi:hypothetical protein